MEKANAAPHPMQSSAGPIAAVSVLQECQCRDSAKMAPSPHVLGMKVAAVLCPGLSAEGWGWGPQLASPPGSPKGRQGEAMCFAISTVLLPSLSAAPVVWLYYIFTTNPVPTVASSCKHFKPVTFILKTNKYQ